MTGELLKDVIIRDQQAKGWLRFRDPIDVIVAWDQVAVWRQLKFVEQAVEERGLYAAGYICYEAAVAFDAALRTKARIIPPGSDLPLLCFGIFSDVERLDSLSPSLVENGGQYQLGPWEMARSQSDYESKIVEIKSMIDSGTTYQVNYTIRQSASFKGDALPFFLRHIGSAPYAAFIDGENYAFCSVSPELFFNFQDGIVTTRPMKGTASRGLSSSADRKQQTILRDSEKDQAENIMIVDMIRNDLSKIAKSGSVKVSDQFKVEKHDSVWGMTSTVKAESDNSVSSIMAALFPCASITGAPKVKAMEIIDSLESTSRNIYTGTIGFIKPGGDAQFNVSIRTAYIEKVKERIHYGVGGGIVADSVPDMEYEECLMKTKVFERPADPEFSILESMLWTPEAGFFLLEKHLERMANTADYFDYPFDEIKLRTALENIAFRELDTKVRVLIDKEGHLEIESYALDKTLTEPFSISPAKKFVHSNDKFLYHKTTHREVYEKAFLHQEGATDVLLWNERNELCESTIANVVIRCGKRLVTPPVDCGLLAGTYRQFLLESREIEEEIIKLEDLNENTEIYLINSVRKWRCVNYTPFIGLSSGKMGK